MDLLSFINVFWMGIYVNIIEIYVIEHIKMQYYYTEEHACGRLLAMTVGSYCERTL